jgi:hypothetical protein
MQRASCNNMRLPEFGSAGNSNSQPVQASSLATPASSRAITSKHLAQPKKNKNKQNP